MNEADDEGRLSGGEDGLALLHGPSLPVDMVCIASPRVSFAGERDPEEISFRKDDLFHGTLDARMADDDDASDVTGADGGDSAGDPWRELDSMGGGGGK